MIMIRSENGEFLGEFVFLRYTKPPQELKSSLYTLYGMVTKEIEIPLARRKTEEEMIKLIDSIHDHKRKYPDDIMDLRLEGK